MTKPLNTICRQLEIISGLIFRTPRNLPVGLTNVYLFCFYFRTVHKGDIEAGEMTVNNLATFCQERGDNVFPVFSNSQY